MNAHTYMSPEASDTGGNTRSTSKFRSQPSSGERGFNIGHLSSNPEIRALQVAQHARSQHPKNDSLIIFLGFLAIAAAIYGVLRV